MRKGKVAASLGKVAEVRDLQRRSAEAEAGRAAEALRRFELARVDCGERLQDGEHGWGEMMAAPSLRLDLAAAWSAEILARQATLADAEVKVGEAEREKAARADAWAAGVARAEAAEDMARDARRSLRRHREEQALADAADRFAGKRREP